MEFASSFLKLRPSILRGDKNLRGRCAGILAMTDTTRADRTYTVICVIHSCERVKMSAWIQRTPVCNVSGIQDIYIKQSNVVGPM